MSFDLAVWGAGAAKGAEADKLYQALCRDPKRASQRLPPAKGVEALYRELTEVHPELQEGGSTWAAKIDRSDRHLILCAVWSMSLEIARTVRGLALEHDVEVFDPQSGLLFAPGPVSRQIEGVVALMLARNAKTRSKLSGGAFCASLSTPADERAWVQLKTGIINPAYPKQTDPLKTLRAALGKLAG